jgi:ABC-type transport system involved in cytochrome bd biosynthesis fused ATPase/permease subunit
MFFSVILVLLEFMVVAMIQFLVKYFDEKIDDLNYLIKITSILVGSKTLSIILYRQYSIFESNLSIKSVNVVYSFLFDKILKVSPASLKNKSNQGEIINYIQVDSAKLKNMITYCPYLFIFPIQIVVYLLILFYYFGISFLYGMIPLIICIIINTIIYKRYAELENEFMSKKDLRMKITTETLDALKLLKMYAWDNIFKDRVSIKI